MLDADAQEFADALTRLMPAPFHVMGVAASREFIASFPQPDSMIAVHDVTDVAMRACTSSSNGTPLAAARKTAAPPPKPSNVTRTRTAVVVAESRPMTGVGTPCSVDDSNCDGDTVAARAIAARIKRVRTLRAATAARKMATVSSL